MGNPISQDEPEVEARGKRTVGSTIIYMYGKPYFKRPVPSIKQF
jgi:hypothetical protein